MPENSHTARQYVLASDFDQTLSFNDTGIVLSELLGISGFREKVAGLSRLNLVQQGGELAYLLRHDPEYRCVRKEHLIEVGRRIRLKRNIGPLNLVPGARAGWLSLRLLRDFSCAGGGRSVRMLHMNHRGGLTIAASEAKYIAQIAKRTIVSDDALSVLVPILEEIVRYEPSQIRALFEGHGFLIQEWEGADRLADHSGEFHRRGKPS